MSYNVNQNQIWLTRGDSMTLTLALYEGDEPYTPASGDVIRFALKQNRMTVGYTEYTDDNPLILKTIDNETLQLTIEPNDTKNLPFGDYVYDIEPTKENGEVDTFITPTKFVIMPEVH